MEKNHSKIVFGVAVDYTTVDGQLTKLLVNERRAVSKHSVTNDR